jgi:hypothetical protein
VVPLDISSLPRPMRPDARDVALPNLLSPSEITRQRRKGCTEDTKNTSNLKVTSRAQLAPGDWRIEQNVSM